MEFYVIMHVFFMVFNDLNLIVVSILKILSKLSFNYIDIISNQISLLRNTSISNAYNHDNQVAESVIIDNGSGMITATSGESTESIIFPNVVTGKETNGARHFAHVNNLNDNYLQFDNDQLRMYCELLFAVLIQRSKIACWNEITAIWEHLLADTMRKEGIVTNQLNLLDNRVTMREYNVQSFYLSNIAFVNFYYGNKIKYDSEAALTETLFEEYGITSRGREERIEYSKDTNVTSHTRFENTNKIVVENTTNPAH